MKWLKEWLKRSKFIVKVYECIALKVKAVKRKFVKVFINRPKAKCSYGEKNKNKTFFVIPASEKSGLYSNTWLALPVMQYAIRRGYVPVLDFKSTYCGMLQDPDKKGLENAWEYYYEQPGQVSIEEVFQSKRVIHYSKEAYDIKTPAWYKKLPVSDWEMQYWHRFITDNLHLQKPIAERVRQAEEALFDGKKKVLGVGVRAAFRAMYLLNCSLIEGHPVVPNCEDMIRIVEGKMKEWSYDYILLHTEDREYQQKFAKHFGDKCLFWERHLDHWFVNDVPTPLERYVEEIHCEYGLMSMREQTEEYIVGVYLLSKCDSLYSSAGGGIWFSYFLNGGKYKHVEIYDEGNYHL